MRLVVVLACALLAGCGSATRTAVTPSSSASAGPAEISPSVIESSVDDPPGSIACARLAVAIEAGSFMTPGVVEDIVSASATADAPLADAATRLGDAYRAAVAAKDKPDEPDKIAAVGAVASDMSGVCAESGLRTVG
jgi:hypothetical protein